jgi:tetratricopeptide (TPR) repeat protein
MTEQLTEVRESIERGDFAEARCLALCALDQPQDQETQARLTHNLALATHRAGDSLEALRILIESATLFEKAESTIRGNYHNELGIVRYNLRQIDTALLEYKTACQFYEEAGDDLRRASTLNNIALVLKDAGRFREAHQHINEARRILERAGSERVREVLDSHSAIVAAQAESQGDHHTEQPINSRSITFEPAAPRGP